MLKLIRISMLVAALGLLAAGCSQQQDPFAPEQLKPIPQDKDGTETLGPPSIDIADGTGFAEGGVGMEFQPGTLNIDVPMGVTINQVLLYWSGGTTADDGDDTIAVDGAPFTGTLIGGGAFFYENYDFYAYRADITTEALVVPGANSFEISEMDFDFSGGSNNENNGVTILVIYDDGTDADLELRDGLDLAYFNFSPPRDATVPQVFTFDPVSEDRVADMVIFAGSVGAGRPNQIVATTTAGDQVFDNIMGSNDGPLWDSFILQVDIPMDVSSLTVELISVPTFDPRGASMSWVGAGLSVPIPPPPELACIGDYVWEDLNMNGIQEMGEPGIENVTVHLMDCLGNTLDGTLTDVNGYYEFCELTPGDYNIHFVLVGGYVFSPQDQGMDDALDSDADPVTGMTVCTNLEPGEFDHTWDAGMYMPQQDGCTHTFGYWKNHAGFGPQDDEVTPLLPIWLGDAGGTKSIQVTDAATAVAIFEAGAYGGKSNGIAKLYIQLLAAKLNFADGASDADVANTVIDADAFLAMYDWMDWDGLSEEDQDMVLGWKDMLDDYNNGIIGPGHCEDEDEMELDD